MILSLYVWLWKEGTFYKATIAHHLFCSVRWISRIDEQHASYWKWRVTGSWKYFKDSLHGVSCSGARMTKQSEAKPYWRSEKVFAQKHGYSNPFQGGNHGIGFSAFVFTWQEVNVFFLMDLAILVTFVFSFNGLIHKELNISCLRWMLPRLIGIFDNCQNDTVTDNNRLLCPQRTLSTVVIGRDIHLREPIIFYTETL